MTRTRRPASRASRPGERLTRRLAVLLLAGPLLAAAPSVRAGGRDLPGDDMSHPHWIDLLPWIVTGNSCDYEPDYDAMCPFGSWGPDVVYAVAPERSVTVTVSLCDSHYDTKLMVYENGPGTLLGCSDDACAGPNFDYPYLSRLEGLSLVAGNTYYIVVKGYCAECGVYVMSVAPEAPCAIDFPGGGLPEGEPECHDGYVDEFNGGCDAGTPAFVPLVLGSQPLIVCGTSGTYTTGFEVRRDTDWYAFTLSAPGTLTARLAAEFDAKLHIFDAAGGCDSPILIGGAGSAACDAALAIEPLAAGSYWLRVSPAPESDAACGARYILALELETDEAGVGPGPDLGALAAAGGLRIAVSPQPARDRAEIAVWPPQPGGLEVALFDPSGRRIRTLRFRGEPVEGRLRLSWDGRDDGGRPVPTGVYGCRAAAAGGSGTRVLFWIR
ncbi:MAG: hypothetical protein FJY75_07545 [Candidatus Eisenbacteria bacterium]|uniref:FlgD/Vpr Ig-like domain-containing protein n=1 Tax=Eiseniibacteriota bacterium TaxID=2212470 RepID=A0A937X8M1_UNCEI|nr:hypothetical protein [Candidatus Eisenbacteria bacterium]